MVRRSQACNVTLALNILLLFSVVEEGDFMAEVRPRRYMAEETVNTQMVNYYRKQFRIHLAMNSGTLEEIQGILEQDLQMMMGQVPPDRKSLLQESLKAAFEEMEAELHKTEFLTQPSVRKLNQLNWYGGPSEDAVIWNRLLTQLREAGRTEDELRSLDEQTTAVLSMLHPPADVRPFRCKGVVVGHVQSGKTGNMAGVLAKAADTQYRFFLVLSGLTEALRSQTQLRFERDLHTADATRWHMWTTGDNDFSASKKQPFQFDPNLRQLAVLKKNKFVLERFLAKLKRTPKSVLLNTPFLIIDDECDQASVNSARFADEMTKINELIRKILNIVPKVSYVGYTATPYANILINPLLENGRLNDLYPENFIYAMTPPASYFGAESLFGRDTIIADAGDVEDDAVDGLDMIREIPEEEAGLYRRSRTAANFRDPYPVVPSLESALHYFLLALAARSARGQKDRHSSMLIHTSHLVAAHEGVATAVQLWLNDVRLKLKNDDPALWRRLQELWEQEANRVPAEDFERTPLGFGEIRELIEDEADSIEVIVENAVSEQRLQFGEEARRYIVVGGNVISRGLTIEGLVVSYFLRTASQYDTLMQMGRWFGYRSGYEDIPRIWMEESVRSSFRMLAMVEAEIREEIAVYHRDQVTPMQFAVKIRQLPGLTITGANKMRHARVAHVSYADRHLQTIRFERRNREWLENNWAAGSALVDAAATQAVETSIVDGNRGRVFRTVPVELILEFLSHYQVQGLQSGMQTHLLRDYIEKRLEHNDSRYRYWNVATVWPARDLPRSSQPLGHLGPVSLATRSSLNDSSHDVADIKALMSRHDLMVDLAKPGDLQKDASWNAIKEQRNQEGVPPLLILYPVDGDSQPQENSTHRSPLDAVHDVLGLGLWFPKAESGSDGDFVHVELPEPDLDPEDEDEYYEDVIEEMNREEKADGEVTAADD